MTTAKKTPTSRTAPVAAPAAPALVVVLPPAPVAPAPAPRAMTSVEGLAIQRALSSEKVKEALEAGVPAGTKADVDFLLRVRGQLAKGDDGDRKATSRALRKATLALLIQRCGVTRENALDILAGVLADVQTLSEEAEQALLVEHPEVEDAFARLDAMLVAAPRIPVAGRVAVRNMVLEVVG